MKKAVIYTDGASSGNPGPSGIGVAIEFEGRTIEIAEHIGTATNNIAEYSALIRALKEARAIGAEVVDIRMDSELAIRQISGRYKVKNQGLKPLYDEAIRLLKSFKKYSARHVRREDNTLADRLSKQGVSPTQLPMRTEIPPVTDTQPGTAAPTGGNTGNSSQEGQGTLF